MAQLAFTRSLCSPLADPGDAATAAAANDDDVDDLYADLDDQVAAALAAAGESDGSNARDSDPATDGEVEVPGADAEAHANEAVDLGDGPAGYSSSDEESEDDFHIVLNEDGGVPPPPSAGRCEEGWVEGSEEGEVSGSLVKGPSINDGGRSKFGGLHCKGFIEKTTVPITGQGDRGHQHAFQKDFYFFSPRNRTVFDINIEAFQQKPWRQPGVDLTDYFNFGLDEEGWRKYCFGMKQFRQGARSLAKESSGLDQESHYDLESIKLMPKSATYSGFEERNDLAKPKGRAIHVEGGVCERLPSADMWRPRQRDSDVVIQVNMMLSPSNHSTSDDSSTVNYKCMTTERISINNTVDQRVKDTSCVVDRVVGKEVHNGGSSDCTGSKLDIRDSACTRDQSSSPDYSDMLSEESTEDCYFKRAHRHSNSNAFYADTKLKDVHVKSDFCHHSSKSDRQSSKGDSHSYTPSPTDDRYHKTTKLLRTDGPPFTSRGFFINCRSDCHLLKSGPKATREQKWQSSAGGRHAVLEKQEKITDSYPSRYSRRYGQKRYSSTLGNNYHNAVHNQMCEKRDYSPLERVALRNDAECFSHDYNLQQRCSSWHEINDDEDVVECFSSAKGWQHCRNHGYGYNSMLKAEPSDDIDGWMYRERYYREKRRVRHSHGKDDKFLHYTDHRFGKLQGPVARGKYRNRRSAESNDEHLRHPDHLVSSPRVNDYLKNSEMDWPAAGLTFVSSRNRCIDNKRIWNAKMMQYYLDGDYNKKKHRDSSFRVDNIQQSALYTGAAAETHYSVLPVKRKLHADMASMNRKDLVGLSFPKGIRLMHDQSMISDRKLYAAEVHNSSKEIDREAICSFSDMRNSNTISNIYDERRHELVNLQPKDTDSIHLNVRKRKFKRQGNEIRREVESGNEGRLPADKDLRGSKHKDVHQKVRKLSRRYHHSGNHDLEKSTFQKRQNIVSINEEDEIEEGELIEQDHQYTVSKSHLKKPRKAVLKSVIAASSAGQLGVINAMSKEAVCNGATRECDNKHVLAVMEKMQKRRERFKEPITQKEEGDGRKELLAVACSADDIKNQRPARKRRWGGSG